MTWQLDINGGETPHEYVVGGHEKFETPVTAVSEPQPGLQPGSTCDLCHRRIPHPKKPTSPTTKPIAYRAPLDEYDAHLEVIDAVAELLGVKEEPYHRFKALSYALACVLQGARLEETGG